MWKLETLNETLLPIDIERIKKIPISIHASSDELVWEASDDGFFRVRDAYNLARNANNSGPIASDSNAIWSKLWKLDIPPKEKIFLWRASWDILTHGVNLRRKGIMDVDKC